MRFFLIGFMGSGKSHWAKRWAAKYKYDFYDVDDTIEAMEMSSIVDIFESKGESWFRDKEAVVLREMIKYDNCIISCGGGTACHHSNIEWMNRNGITIFFDASPAYLLSNILKDREKRPLVKQINENELIYFIQQKLDERKKFYSKAQITLNAPEITENTFGGILYSLNL